MTELLAPGSPEFHEKFERFRHTWFRLETLPEYAASGENAALAAFLAGEPEPPDYPFEEWLEMIRAHGRAGRRMQRVHVVREPLTDYLRYELTWGYARTGGAGEEIRILAVSQGQPWPAELPEGTDYWLFDSHELYHQRYGPGGEYQGAEPVPDAARIVAANAWRDAALHLSVPWATYVRGRPELVEYLPDDVLAS